MRRGYVMSIAMTIETATEQSGLSRSRLYDLMGAGEIDSRKIGRRTMILSESLKNYIERQPRANIRAPKSAT
jgi:excisionase family DNA binding protein